MSSPGRQADERSSTTCKQHARTAISERAHAAYQSIDPSRPRYMTSRSSDWPLRGSDASIRVRVMATWSRCPPAPVHAPSAARVLQLCLVLRGDHTECAIAKLPPLLQIGKKG